MPQFVGVNYSWPYTPLSLCPTHLWSISKTVDTKERDTTIAKTV